MSTRIQITTAFIQALAHSTPRRRKLILRNATKAELEGLFELCLNLLRGKIPLSNDQYNKFKRERKAIEALSSRRVSLQQKRKIINQRGGFLGQLAVFALPLLTNIIANQISKRSKR